MCLFVSVCVCVCVCGCVSVSVCVRVCVDESCVPVGDQYEISGQSDGSKLRNRPKSIVPRLAQACP